MTDVEAHQLVGVSGSLGFEFKKEKIGGATKTGCLVDILDPCYSVVHGLLGGVYYALSS